MKQIFLLANKSTEKLVRFWFKNSCSRLFPGTIRSSFDPGNTGTGEGGNSGTIWHRGWPGFVRLSIILVADGKAYHGRKTKGVELALFFFATCPNGSRTNKSSGRTITVFSLGWLQSETYVPALSEDRTTIRNGGKRVTRKNGEFCRQRK